MLENVLKVVKSLNKWPISNDKLKVKFSVINVNK